MPQVFLPDDQITVDLDQIQGDVLIGLQKRAEVFVLLEISDPAQFRIDLATVLGDVTFLRATKDVEQTKPGPFISLNMAFSVTGLEKVGLITDATKGQLDASFVAGAFARASGLADDPMKWRPEYRNPIDMVLLVAASGVTIDAAKQSAMDQANGFIDALKRSTSVSRIEPGAVRAAQVGHEHFGFADGISQPGVLGLTLPGANPDQGFPGQDLVKPGEFVFGPYDNENGGQSIPPFAWMANGSYLVFRRLQQDVAAFQAYTAANFSAAGRTSAGQLAAQLVGRWPDGSPVVLAPAANDPNRDASHPDTNNDFNFGPQDPNQRACPFLAHIRKVYPRDDFPGESEKHRILRAGIPFGDDGDADKGLLFVCYQTSIMNKFEFLQVTWANNPNFMFGKTTSTGRAINPGIDMIIGQPAPRRGDLSTDAAQVNLPDAPLFVTATGGGYFFSPSKAALTQIAAAP